MTKKVGEFYVCKECGYRYEKKEMAEKCEAWCREHQSCNLEIIKYGRPPAAKNENNFTTGCF